VAHSGRWYLTGFDSASGQVRTFRVDRITTVRTRVGTFDVPAGFDPAQRVLTAIAETPYQHEVSVRIRSTPEQIRSVFPPAVAALEEITVGDTPWVRARIRAQRLEWIPPLLAALDRPFVVEQPDTLRDLVRALASRLASHADARQGD
jgi:predicted DNA-binding transcriptional regulator YafY